MNIFVAKLNFSTTSEELQSLFEQYGVVDSAKVIVDHETGKSKGFGFVEMSNDEEAQKAIDTLNQTEFHDRTIVVKEARPKEENPRFEKKSFGGGGGYNKGGGGGYNKGGGYGGGNSGGGYNKGGGYGGGNSGGGYNKGGGYGGGNSGGGYNKGGSSYNKGGNSSYGNKSSFGGDEDEF
jgi:RNA recognition motif-containing protein